MCGNACQNFTQIKKAQNFKAQEALWEGRNAFAVQYSNDSTLDNAGDPGAFVDHPMWSCGQLGPESRDQFSYDLPGIPFLEPAGWLNFCADRAADSKKSGAGSDSHPRVTRGRHKEFFISKIFFRGKSHRKMQGMRLPNSQSPATANGV
jgi:hypothetical protein